MSSNSGWMTVDFENKNKHCNLTKSDYVMLNNQQTKIQMHTHNKLCVEDDF